MVRLTSLLNPVPATRDAGLLVLRVGAGLALALAHGLGKLPPPDRFVVRTADLGFPAPLLFAWLAALAEFGGGLLVALGLATRPAAAFAAFTMATAFFGAHAGDPFGDRETAFLYGIVLLTLVFTGAGRYSLDAAFAGHRR